MKFWAAIAAFFTLIGDKWFTVRMGRKNAKLQGKVDDYENADDIRRRVDRADRLLRKHDGSGWRD